MKCPFLEEIMVAYCNACKVKKMLPRNSLTLQNKCNSHYQECAVYKEFLVHNKKEEDMTAKVSPDSGISDELQPCIWMKAGVIVYRMCSSDYDCKNCEFDRTLTQQGSAESSLVTQAIAKLRQLPATERKCRYMLTGDFSHKICPNNYECWHCAVDQYIQDTMDANPLLRKRRQRMARREKKVRGFAINEDFFYLPNHIWVKIEADLIRIGIDDFAIRLIGKIDRIELPQEDAVGKSSRCWQLGGGTRMVDMSLPFEGGIVEKNQLAESDPDLVSKEPYGRGWLLKIKALSDLPAMLKGPQVTEWIEKEFDKLHNEFEKNVGVTITDGGELVQDVHERLSDQEWRDLIRQFLW